LCNYCIIHMHSMVTLVNAFFAKCTLFPVFENKFNTTITYSWWWYTAYTLSRWTIIFYETQDPSVLACCVESAWYKRVQPNTAELARRPKVDGAIDTHILHNDHDHCAKFTEVNMDPTKYYHHVGKQFLVVYSLEFYFF